MKIPNLLLVLLIVLPVVSWAGGGHDHAAEAPTVAVTLWSETMELFMEHPVLTTGHPGRFAIHLTVLDGFAPVQEGSVTLVFRGPGRSTKRVHAGDLSREGLFTPEVTLDAAGPYEFEVSYRGSRAEAVFTIDEFFVFEDHGALPHAAYGGSEDDITFLKEQQWKVPFATAPAVSREMKRAVWAIGEVLPSPAAFFEIVAPVDGILQATDLALPGARVERGDVVARILPPVQGGGWAASELDLAQAERNYERAQRLHEKDAISQRDFEEARNAYLARKAGQQGVEGSGSDGVLSLTAPIDGLVIDWQVRPGQRLSAGDKLMAVADPTVVWLRVNVYQNDFRTLGTPVGAFVNSGADGGWSIPPEAMTVLTTGGGLDPVTRTVPVLLRVDNPDGRLTINESTPVELYASDGTRATAVPRSAVFDDDGRTVVFVQTGGESFAKRTVRIGAGHREWVSVLSGISPGERVVTRGGYHVKLASTTAEIGHGHAH